MDALLDQLVKLRGVGGCILVSTDGLAMASRLRSDQEEEGLAAQLAELVTRSQDLTGRLDLGSPRMVHAQYSQGAVAVMAAGPSYLGVLVDPNANLALLQLEIKPFVEAIAKRLGI